LTNKDVEIPVTRQQIGHGIGYTINYMFEGSFIALFIYGIMDAIGGGNLAGLTIGFAVVLMFVRFIIAQYALYGDDYKGEETKEINRQWRKHLNYHWYLLSRINPYKLHLKE